MKFAILPSPWSLTVDELEGHGHHHVDIEDNPDVLIYHGGAEDFPEALPDSVQLVQFAWAGIDALNSAGILARTGTRWANGAGLYDDTAAESTLALILAGLHQFARVTPDGSTKAAIESESRYLVEGMTVAIIGAGGIGKKLIQFLAPFNAEIIAVNRSGRPVDGADETLPMAEADGVWGRADVVVLLAPLTAETRGMVDSKVLAAMKDTAVLVNVGRGPLVVTDNLVAALSDGTIAGAALDVTDPEPLPADHPLWEQDRCLITPHTASTPRFGRQRIAGLTLKNWEALQCGKEMPTEVDVEQGY
ncbi:D-isomer specific 2-hydroxyacid dehydrogenase family protein [Corynebacterium sp. p3-SID1145]|uniref:D-isomer specific 2-hydroxyacid dehydrogenase family protein n=1 Tax=unclassified Corynebacterium TaxID=2624378 RepID=UPI0021AAC9A8|nr:MULTISPECIES: D-isomer specific 2-hydroxyacid dehydrogenase family protein [unclassified Corynebacterium]MCT1452678.1 D-isomer specific 2-hydroxyacid dehydrogenase family protein [Corynebacterium sp. p3-SID1145]MCT1461580.1 D-isomer specific 2-hydroxyacid dehydrogenase family protein [Corynebacterium sp. p3-SID1140]